MLNRIINNHNHHLQIIKDPCFFPHDIKLDSITHRNIDTIKQRNSIFIYVYLYFKVLAVYSIFKLVKAMKIIKNMLNMS